MDKRTVSTALAKYAVNPIVSRVAGYVPWFALLETRGRRTGRPRRNPVGDGLRGDVFWLVADHGLSSSFVKNIRHDPRVRVRTLGLGANGLVVRLLGTTLLTVRIALDPPHAQSRSR
jgi:hypothetical protein